MADVPISSLPSASALTGTELIPLVQGGVTSKSTPNAIGTLLLAPTIYRVSGSDFTTSSTSLVDITGLSHAATANKYYRVEVDLFGQSSLSSGAQIAVACSGGTAVGWHFGVFNGSSTGLASTSAVGLNAATGVNMWTLATTDLGAKLWGHVLVGGSSGNITAQIKKITSGSVTIRIGSMMTVTLLN